MTSSSARRWGRRLLDLAGYAVGLSVAALSLIVPMSAASGHGLVGVKVGLFLAGVACAGYATVLRWPSRSMSDSDTDRDGRPTGFEALLDRFPPWRWISVHPYDRFHPGTKLYAAAAVLFGVSFLLEAVFGVGV